MFYVKPHRTGDGLGYLVLPIPCQRRLADHGIGVSFNGTSSSCHKKCHL